LMESQRRRCGNGTGIFTPKVMRCRGGGRRQNALAVSTDGT
jgi:hypothetical protein